MLDPQYRLPVAYWLGNKFLKEDQDLTVPSKPALIEKLVSHFNDPNYVAKGPHDVGHLEWDPKSIPTM
jgi:hypothetical protein